MGQTFLRTGLGLPFLNVLRKVNSSEKVTNVRSQDEGIVALSSPLLSKSSLSDSLLNESLKNEKKLCIYL